MGFDVHHCFVLLNVPTLQMLGIAVVAIADTFTEAKAIFDALCAPRIIAAVLLSPL